MTHINWKPGLLALAVVGGALGFTLLESLADGETIGLLELLMDTVEKSLVLVGAGGVGVLLHRMRAQHREKLALIAQLDVARVEGTDWRRRVQSLMDGLGAEIHRQFRRWDLTDAESEVGLLLIKGLSHKQIASLRGTAETTVRQQARTIYLKSGLPGRSAFSAYFLEDLLPPADFSRAGPAAGPAPQAAEPAATEVAVRSARAEDRSLVFKTSLDGRR